jgi:hypothetical protein
MTALHSIEVCPPTFGSSHCNGCQVATSTVEMYFGGRRSTVIAICDRCAEKLLRLLKKELGR